MNRRILEFSVVSAKGQVVIPKEIRDELDIKPGTRLAWSFDGGQLQVIRVPDDPVRALRGVLKGKGSFGEWLAERNAERERERGQDEEEAARWRATSSTPRR
jgi:AbrB family looped-hinge helix DNA binding protein